MTEKKFAIVLVVAATLLAARFGRAEPGVSGLIAGHVFIAGTSDPVAGVRVEAVELAEETTFQAETNPSGTYSISDAPAGLYQFTLSHQGVDYPVRAPLDVRVNMPFILESCFELDGRTATASVREECVSGFVEEARVASIGSRRVLLPPDVATQPAAADVPREPNAIEHDEIECVTREYFPIADAIITPGEQVLNCFVYFRSDKYPDFYYVELVNAAAASALVSSPAQLTADDFRAILPKPSAETERLIYYLECVTPTYNSIQAGEFHPPIVPPESCQQREGSPPWYAGNPNIVVGTNTPGLPAVPPGFQAAGITGFINSFGVLSGVGAAVGGATGGGVSAGTLILAGGATAAGIGTFIVLTSGDEASPPR